ncbi:phosphoglucomutase-2 [Aplysia californica]|uniref:Phosphoglucomutase-2 n=1 Tax=Aplysia californica TaxID=6500 RepID=A0ABM0K0Q9_APLCA|nr:phosphoglucomutase-2 [Aplysia californica]XP_005106033.1 phosphoglucomutase-2 [Aplysia californica]XP_035827674.1 phosphoglucomutase-2 [Aplysia californica]
MSSSNNTDVDFEPTGDNAVDNEIRKWLLWDKNEKTRLEIKALVDEKNIPELKRLLLHRMEFGTAGLRTRMGPGNSQMNDLTMIQTTQGLAKYLKASLPTVSSKGVVIGFDGRHNSYKWSRIVGTIFVNERIPVYLFSRLCPTPYVAYGVRAFDADCGIMITASHNPKEDNGYKVYWNNGAQIVSPHDKGISQAIDESLEPLASSWDVSSLERLSSLVKDPMEETLKRYNADVLSLCYLREKNAECPVRLTYTAMHGVGYEFAVRAMKEFGFLDPIPVLEQVQPDPDFPTVKYPNPEEGEGALKLAMETADRNKSKVILANDPDADRLAVAEKIDSGWRVFTGNEIGAFLGWWCFTAWRQKNPSVNLSDVYMLASTVSSKILEAFARKEGFNFIETLTGFKWMGNEADRLLKEGKYVLFAFEEAIGYMCGSKVLDKDGVSAAAAVGELVNHLYSSGTTLSKQLEVIYQTYGYHMSSNSYFKCYDADTIKAMFERLRNYDGEGKYPSKCGDYAIAHVRDLTVGYDSETIDKKPKLPCSKSSQMITFKFENGCVATLRTSGTEPKIKYYAEHRPDPEHGLDYGQVKEQLNGIVESIAKYFYSPDVFPKILPRDT